MFDRDAATAKIDAQLATMTAADIVRMRENMQDYLAEHVFDFAGRNELVQFTLDRIEVFFNARRARLMEGFNARPAN